MQSKLPYCPFKIEVGEALIQCVEHIEDLIPSVVQLLREMSAEKAEKRPSTREAVNQLNSEKFHRRFFRLHLKKNSTLSRNNTAKGYTVH
ncbi:hypothetical protein BT96DRAFT_990015 [Gymnopus androsaceus JB14]|uniref:Uncharacterized protein n=1 Tax=Gymnopus androsaceus JB14 TaxID=1447944 RepID=A0A6A4I018_9AGAR|nr:hypothetical protein BT96DRAFT_990015 [Gymnopus androsaceus JB14]